VDTGARTTLLAHGQRDDQAVAHESDLGGLAWVRSGHDSPGATLDPSVKHLYG
jgi:hypothetical protein